MDLVYMFYNKKNSRDPIMLSLTALSLRSMYIAEALKIIVLAKTKKQDYRFYLFELYVAHKTTIYSNFRH